MKVEAVLEKKDEKKRLRRLIFTIVVIAVAVHLIAGGVAAVLVVARYFLQPQATFEVQKDIRLPAREREHRMNMAEFDAMTPKPSFTDQMQALRPTEFALPDLPKVPLDQMLPLDPSAIVTDQVASMVGTAGTGAAGEGGSGSGGVGSGMSFFGIQDAGRSVIIVVDTSNSMFERSRRGEMHRFDFKTIKEQATQLIDKLNINTRFNVIIYEGGSMAFSKEFLPATDANKAAAREWIQGLSEDPDMSIGKRPGRGPKLMEGGGTRLDTAMKQTFSFQPEVVYIITDGEINRGSGSRRESERESRNSRNYSESDKIGEREMLAIISELQKELPEPARIHTILYETSVVRPEEERTIRAIARHNGGKFRKVEAKEIKK